MPSRQRQIFPRVPFSGSYPWIAKVEPTQGLHFGYHLGRYKLQLLKVEPLPLTHLPDENPLDPVKLHPPRQHVHHARTRDMIS